MTINSKIVKECHALVWQYRSKLDSVWPTPPPLHAIMFAVTELGEMVDAEMRTYPEYKRNNEREVEEFDEAADVAMMLLTAVPSLDEKNVRNYYYTSTSSLATKVTSAWSFMSTGHTRSAEDEALMAVGMIADMEGMDLPKRIQDKLERTSKKFGGSGGER